MSTATNNTNVTTDVSTLVKQGMSKTTSSEINNEQLQIKTEMNVPTANSSNDNINTLSGTNSNDTISESSIRNDMEPSNEQEILRRRRLQKFSAQLTAE